MPCLAGFRLILAVQTGYNLLYGLWRYSFDADCDLFLKILKGDVKEDIYLAQIELQAGVLASEY